MSTSKNTSEGKLWLDFEAIKKEADVEPILEHYNLLERLQLSGDAYIGHCPLGTKKHGKGDSFNFNVKRKTFKCFACKQHGSVLDFVAKYQGLHLRESAQVILDIMASDEENEQNEETEAVAESDKEPLAESESIESIDDRLKTGLPIACDLFEVIGAIKSGDRLAGDYVVFNKEELKKFIEYYCDLSRKTEKGLVWFLSDLKIS